MAELVVIGAVLLVLQGILGVLEADYHLRMIDEVNSHLPEGEQFSYEWWHLPKCIRLWKKHLQCFPSSLTRQRIYVHMALHLLFLIPFLYVVVLVMRSLAQNH